MIQCECSYYPLFEIGNKLTLDVFKNNFDRSFNEYNNANKN
jgi:hypothetical protein